MNIPNIKDDRVLITSDVMFALVMQDKEICKGVVERILRREISDITYPEGQKRIQELLSDKSIVLDVYFKDEEGTKYNVEMQKANNGDIPRRSRFYHSKMDSTSSKRGMEYGELDDSYVIFICTFDLFKKGFPVYTFSMNCEEDNTINMGDGQKTVFVNLTSMMLELVDINLRNVILYMREESVNDDFTKKLSDKVEEANLLDKSEGGPIMTLEEKIEYDRMGYRKEAMEEGREEGLKAGIKEGRKEGIKEGRKEGLKEGRIRELKDLLKLVDSGDIRVDTIKKLGFTEEEINDVKMNNE